MNMNINIRKTVSKITGRKFYSQPVILSAVRTPIGSAWGSLSTVKGTKLASLAITGALEKSGVSTQDVDEVLLGNVLQAGQGQAPARQAAIGAGLPVKVSCTTVNKVCASGMKTITMAAQSIKTGDNKVVVCGGFESMSQVPYICDPKTRTGLKYGHAQMLDLILQDGLTDVYNNFHMGNCAEDCVSKFQFTREQQDEYSIRSYKLSAQASSSGKFKDEIISVEVDLGRGKIVKVSEDEEFKNVDFAKVPTLKPAFIKNTGTVTAANSSTLNDGASALVVTSDDFAQERNLKPIARIIGYADAETNPIEFTVAPSLAIPLALKKAGLKVSDIDFWEINEAFAVVSLANIKLLNLDIEKVNVNGGAVSLGHPIGCSGARIVTTLVHILKQNGKRYGCAAICNGGGGATAIIVENIQ